MIDHSKSRKYPAMQRLKLVKWPILLAIASILLACDPLAPDAKPVVIVVTSTPRPTPIPTAVPRAPNTDTPIPPTATTEVTATLESSGTPEECGDNQGQVLDLE